jgi:hypothetical protein
VVRQHEYNAGIRLDPARAILRGAGDTAVAVLLALRANLILLKRASP